MGLPSPYFFTAAPMLAAPLILSSRVAFMKSVRPPMKPLARSAPCRMAAERNISCTSMAALAWATAFTLKAPWA